jgi:hypothetical protein
MEIASRQLFFVNALRTRASSTPAGMQSRFMTRAIEAGVPLSRPPVAQRYPHAFRFALVATALLLIASLAWNAVFERHATVVSDWAGAPAISAAPPSLSLTSTAEKKESSLSRIRRPVKKQRLRKRPSQMQAQLLADVPSGVSRQNEEHVFIFDSAFLTATTTTLGDPGGFHTEFHPFTSGYFLSDVRRRNLGLPSLSALSLWSANEQNEPHKRVFHYSAALTSLLFVDHPVDFGSRSNIPDLSVTDALDPVRLR